MIRLMIMNKGGTPKYFKWYFRQGSNMREIGPKNLVWGLKPITREGIRLIKYAAVNAASPHR